MGTVETAGPESGFEMTDPETERKPAQEAEPGGASPAFGETASPGSLLARFPSWGPLLLFLALMTGWYAPLLTGDQTYFFFDTTFLTYPSRFFLRETYLQGALPFWIHQIHHGEPFLAEMYLGAFYPLNLFLLGPDLITGINGLYVFHYLMLGTGVWLVVRQWGLSAAAGMCGAVTAVFSGFYLSSAVINNFFLAGCWFPLILFCLERHWRTGRRRWALAALGALTLQTLAGAPEISVLTVLGLGGYALWGRADAPGPTPARRLAGLGLITLLCLGLSAPQLLPTYRLKAESVRQEGLPFEHHARWSIEWTQAAEMLVPLDFSGLMTQPLDAQTALPYQEPRGFLLSLYMGVFAVWVLLAALLDFKTPRPVRFWAGLFGAGLFMGLGQFNPVYRTLYETLPLMNSLRYPEKFFFWCALGLIFLSAHGADSLAGRRDAWTLRPRTWWFAALVAGGLMGLVAWWRPLRDPVPVLLVLAALLVILGLRQSRRNLPIPAGWLVCALCLLDLGYWHHRIPPLVSRDFYQTPPALLSVWPETNGPCRVYSGQIERDPPGYHFPGAPDPGLQILTGTELLLPWTGVAWGLEYADGISGVGLELYDWWIYEELLTRSPPDKRRRILERSNVCVWIDHDQPLAFANRTPLIFPERIKTLPGALPRAFLVNRVRRGQSPQLLNTFYQADFNPLKEVLVNEPVTLRERADFTGRVDRLRYAPNRVEVATRLNGEGVLVMLDSFAPGWEVTVDGQPGKLLRANHFFRGVRLTPGRHEVVFHYHPPGFREGLGIAALSLVAGLFVLGRRKGGGGSGKGGQVSTPV